MTVLKDFERNARRAEGLVGACTLLSDKKASADILFETPADVFEEMGWSRHMSLSAAPGSVFVFVDALAWPKECASIGKRHWARRSGSMISAGGYQVRNAFDLDVAFELPLLNPVVVQHRAHAGFIPVAKVFVKPSSFRLSRVGVRILCESQRSNELASTSATAPSEGIPFDVPSAGIEQISHLLIGALVEYARRTQALRAHDPSKWPKELLLADFREPKVASFRSDVADHLQDRLDLSANAVTTCLKLVLNELIEYLDSRVFEAKWGTISYEKGKGLLLSLKDEFPASAIPQRSLAPVRAL